jgi:hypothetical protein
VSELFETPIRATRGDRHLLFWGIVQMKVGHMALVSNDDGSVELVLPEFLVLDWRYDPKNDVWIDLHEPEAT